VKSLYFSLDTFFPMFQFTQTAHRVHSFSDLEMLTVTIIWPWPWHIAFKYM